MKLSDVMSGAGLSFYAEVALVIFLFVFVVVGARAVFARSTDLDRAARLPFDDGDSEPGVHTSSAPRRAE